MTPMIKRFICTFPSSSVAPKQLQWYPHDRVSSCRSQEMSAPSFSLSGAADAAITRQLSGSSGSHYCSGAARSSSIIGNPLSDAKPTIRTVPVIGELIPAEGNWVIHAPNHCTNHHPLGPEQVLVGHLACLPCGGHTTWTCLQCDAVAYGPPPGEGCSVLNGPAAVRNSFRSSSN